MEEENRSTFKTITTGIAVSVGTAIITGVFKIVKSYLISTIDVGEWDSSYNNINKLLYKKDEEKYKKNKSPTTSNEWYDLACNVSYFIKLDSNNFLKVETYKEKHHWEKTRLNIN